MPNEPSTPATGDTRDFWSQHSISPDTTKKAAPVDTVRLKKDIDKDKDAANKLDNMDGSNKSSNLVDDQPEFRGAQALKDRAKARQDTLNKARKP